MIKLIYIRLHQVRILKSPIKNLDKSNLLLIFFFLDISTLYHISNIENYINLFFCLYRKVNSIIFF